MEGSWFCSGDRGRGERVDGGEKKGDVRFLTLRHSTRQKPAQRSRPIACLLARLGLLIVSEAPVSKSLEKHLLLIPSFRVRAVENGMLKECGRLDGCDCGEVCFRQKGERYRRRVDSRRRRRKRKRKRKSRREG